MCQAKRRVCALVVILCLWSEMTWAAGFQTLLDTNISLCQPSAGDKLAIYQDHTGELILRLRKKAEGKDEFFVYKDQQCIFQKELEHSDFYQIYKLRNLNDKRIFYVMNSAKENWLMGYDAKTKCWQLYVTGTELSISDGTKMFFENDGALLWTVHSEEKKALLQRYQLFWDEKANWFGYRAYDVQPAVGHADKASISSAELSGQVDG